jgi:predicted nucleic-acid-binding protein
MRGRPPRRRRSSPPVPGCHTWRSSKPPGCWPPSYERTPTQLAAVVERLLDHDRLSIQEPDVVRAALSQFREAPRLGFSDCLMLQVARKAGHTPLGTFDRSLGSSTGAQRL